MAQIVIDAQSRRIIATHFGTGREHDFAVFKRSNLRLHPQTRCLADLGYLGLDSYHAQVELPHKKPKGKDLSDSDKEANRHLAKRRVVVEHVIGRLKVFKIIAEKYRNRRERYDLRFNLIAAIYNYQLDS